MGGRGGGDSKVIDYLKEMLLEDGSLGKIQKKVSNIMGLLSNLWWSLMSCKIYLRFILIEQTVVLVGQASQSFT